MNRVDINVTIRQIDIFPLKPSRNYGCHFCQWHMPSHPAVLTQPALSPVSYNILSFEIDSNFKCVVFTQAFQFLALISVTNCVI
jgi:hypothetical protein